jgi:hypothetical protein
LRFPGSVSDSSRPRRHRHPVRAVRLAALLAASLPLGFRSVSGVLSLFAEQDGGEAPSPCTARRWLLRLSLARLRRACRAEPGGWTLVIDHTLGQGTRKCFAVLGIPTRTLLAREGRRLSLADVSVLAVEVMDGSSGEKVEAVLRGLAPGLGQITQLVCDHGGDLLNGIRRLQGGHPGTVLTYDVRHLLAWMLKRRLKDCPRWAAFLAECGKAMPRLRQTAGNFLAPPVLRVKARWMNLGGHAAWALRLSAWRREGRWAALGEALGKSAAQAEGWFGEAFGWLEGFDEDVRAGAGLTGAAATALALVQQEGLCRRTAGLFWMRWSEGRRGHPRCGQAEDSAREAMERLKEEGAKLGKRQVGLGSSDAVESLFGKLKEATGRGPEKALGASVLLMTLMYGPPVEAEEAKAGLEEVGTEDLRLWVEEHLGESDGPVGNVVSGATGASLVRQWMRFGGIRPSKRMAKWFRACFQPGIGIVHFFDASLIAR